MRVARLLVLAVLTAAPLSTASVRDARAEPTDSERNTARAAMKRGDAAAGLGDHAAALTAYQQADAIMMVPTTGQAVARTLARLGRLVEAHNKALDVTRLSGARESKAFADASDEARALARELEPRIPTIVVVPTPRPSRFRISVDGVDVPEGAEAAPWRVNPGEHAIEVRAEGFASGAAAVKLGEREQQRVTVKLKELVNTMPMDPPEDGESGTIAPEVLMGVGFGVAGAGAIVGAITGALALDKNAEVESTCNATTHTCPASARDTLAEGDRFATISTVALVAGGVGLAVGVSGLIWRLADGGDPAARAEVSVHVAPGEIGLRGRF